MTLRRCLLVLVALILWAGMARADEIHTVAREGNLERLAALIKADPNLTTLADNRLCRPIHFAADGGNVDALQMLLVAGARLDVVDIDGDTPLHWATISGRLEVAVWLLDHGADIDARNNQLDTPLLYAVKQHQYDVVERLIARGADMELANHYGRTPLLWTVREGGDLRMARLLLQRGANVNAHDRFGDTPLSLAAWRGFKTMVGVLLDNGAEVEIEGRMGQSLLNEAAARGITRLYSKLVDAGMVIPAKNDNGLLLAAAAGGSSEIVADLLERGSRIDATDDYGWTALHYAAARRRAGAAAELLKEMDDLNRRTLSGYSALNLAKDKGAPAVAELLRKKGAKESPRKFPKISGPYLGQKAPGKTPQLFASDIVATPYGQHGNVSFSPDGREVFWSGSVDIPDSGYTYGTILTSREKNGRWSAPAMASFAGERQGDDVPFFAPDGQTLFFLSKRPLEPGQENSKENIWTVKRTADGWAEPRPLSPSVNRFQHHWQISVAASGNLYFASRRGEEVGIYMSSAAQGEYGEPVFLGFGGETPFIAPDESYLVTFDFTETGGHNFIRFRRGDGAWGDAIDLTEATDRGIGGLCPAVSPGGRYFYFINGQNGANNAWWVDADFIDALRDT